METSRSSARSLILAVRRSASRREFTNTMLERCAATMSTTRSATEGHTDARSASPAALPEITSLPSVSTNVSPMRSKSATVDSTSTTIFLSIGGAMTATESGSVARM